MSARPALIALLLIGCYDDKTGPFSDETDSVCGGQEGSPDGFGPCDDADPLVWDEGRHNDDLETANIPDFCDGYRRRDVEGSARLIGSDLADLRDLRG